MLHDKPTRDTIRNRRAGNYRALESEDEDATEEVEVVQDDKIDRTGWMALTWSFTISAGFTVSRFRLIQESVLMLKNAAAEYRVPSSLCHPHL
jgi:hypothetical protein